MKYRVLHCLYSMNRGGAETFIMNVYRAIDRNHYSFDFLLRKESGAYIEEINSLGGRIYAIPPRSAGYFCYLRHLNLFFKTNASQFDAVHVHTSSLSSLEVLFFAKIYGIKNRIIHSHSTVQTGFIHNVLHLLHKPILHLVANKYLACSEVARNWLYKYTGIFNQSVVVKNGVDLERFSFSDKKRESIREEFSIPNDAMVLGHVGRFDVVKNHSFLLDVFQQYQRLDNTSYLLLVGDGPLNDELHLKVRSKEIQNVIFAGLRTDVDYLISAIDIIVFPSLYEGLPVSLVEAQAGGLPIVCSDKVSSEVKLSDAVFFFSLDDSADIWAQKIHQLKHFTRKEISNAVVEQGYSIKSTVSFLTKCIYV